MEAPIQSEINRLLKILRNSTPESKNAETFKKLLHLIKFPTTLPRANGHLLLYEESHLVYKNLNLERFGMISQTLLEINSVNWWQTLENEETQSLYENFFFYGVPHLVLNSLLNSIKKFEQSFRLSKCVSLLERFIKNGGILRCVMDECTTGETEASGGRQEAETRKNELTINICSLPQYLANKLHTEVSDICKPHNYVVHLADHVTTTIQFMHDKLAQGFDVDSKFLSLLFGKISLVGYSDIFWSSLIRKIEHGVEQDFLLSRILIHTIGSIADRCLESVIVPILKHVSRYEIVSRFVGDLVVERQQVDYLLCTKLLLLRYFDQVAILVNLIGYLATGEKRKPYFLKLLTNLLTVWSDGSAIRRTSHAQHLFVSRSLMICLAFGGDSLVGQKEGLMQKLLPGVEGHLSCPNVKVRNLGMAVAQNFIKYIDPTGPQLEFDVEMDEDVASLLQLLNVKTPNCFPLKKNFTDEKQKPSESTSKEAASFNTPDENNTQLDSDDDLEPYDLSHDVPKSKVKSPHYIRDCMEGLIDNSDHDRVEVCLVASTTLINSEPHGLKELSAEFCKILLHLSNNYSIPDFTGLRFTAMVALTVLCPLQVAEYLTKEFYQRNYNVRQRLDILEVISKAAEQLSSGRDKSGGQVKPIIEPVSQETESWRDVVERRIESKTRRFHTSKPLPPEEVQNRFSPVAGHFLFPLLRHYDTTDAHCHLLGEDSLLLCRLVYTTGILINCAANAPIARKMAESMFEFTWILRYHRESSVRRAVLFAAAMTYLSLPPSVLFSQFSSDVDNHKQWLRDVVSSDVDAECKKLALQLTFVLDDLYKQEFERE